VHNGGAAELTLTALAIAGTNRAAFTINGATSGDAGARRQPAGDRPAMTPEGRRRPRG
jgi:hypothetical protein